MCQFVQKGHLCDLHCGSVQFATYKSLEASASARQLDILAPFDDFKVLHCPFRHAFIALDGDDPLDDNRDFAKKTKADFPMLSDPSKEIAKAFDVLSVFGVASRVTFYIGKDGKILKIDDNINTATAAEDIARTLAELNVAKKT